MSRKKIELFKKETFAFQLNSFPTYFQKHDLVFQSFSVVIITAELLQGFLRRSIWAAMHATGYCFSQHISCLVCGGDRGAFSTVLLCIRAEVFDSWFHRHSRTESDFSRKLRRSNEHCSRTKSNHGSNRVEPWVEQGRIMSRTGSIESNRVESWVEHGRIMSRTGSNPESNRV